MDKKQISHYAYYIGFALYFIGQLIHNSIVSIIGFIVMIPYIIYFFTHLKEFEDGQRIAVFVLLALLIIFVVITLL